jgi:hypothetical protein
MAKATTKLNAQDRVILFCAATGIDHAAVGILAHDAVNGYPGIHRARSLGRGVYATDSGRAAGNELATAQTALADGPVVDWEASMRVKNRKQFAHRIDMWDEDGANLVDHLAGVEDLDVAAATYRAACRRWPKAKITLRQGARVVEKSW